MTWGRIGFLILVLLAASAVNAMALALAIPDFVGIDFAVFQRVSSVPLDEIYSANGPMPFLYPPTAILLFKAVASLPFSLWVALSVLAFFLAVRPAISNASGFSFLSHAAIKGIQLGQIPMLLGAGLFAGLRLSPIFGGLIWGAVASIKPQLMIFAPLALVVRRDWPMFGGMVVGGTVMFGASLFLGIDRWSEWISATMAFASGPLMEGGVSRSITPAGIALKSGLPMLPFLLGGASIGTLAVFYSARRLEDATLIGLIVAASLITSPYAYAHDTIALIPACIVMMLRGRWAYAAPAAMLFIGTPLLAMTGMMWLLAAWSLDGAKQLKAKPSLM